MPHLSKILFNLRYLGSPPWDTGTSPPELLEYIHSNTPGKALDLGCGTGLNMLSLYKAGWQVTGVEFAWLAVKAAKKRFKKEGVKDYSLIQRNVMNVMFADCTFDLILDIGCFHGLANADKAKYIQRLPGWLTNDGTYLLYGHLSSAGDSRGINSTDLDELATRLSLQRKESGFDKTGPRSVWAWYKKESSTTEK